MDADLIISATSSPLPILGKGLFERSAKIRKHRPQVVLDLAVPRDVEPEVRDLRDVYLYDLDDLNRLVNQNQAARLEVAKEAERVIDLEVQSYLNWQNERRSVPAIRAFRKNYEQEAEALLDQALMNLAKGEDPASLLKQFKHQLMQKLLHGPTQCLLEAAQLGQIDFLRLSRAFYESAALHLDQ